MTSGEGEPQGVLSIEAAAGEENPKELCPLRFSSPEPPPFLNPDWLAWKNIRDRQEGGKPRCLLA